VVGRFEQMAMLLGRAWNGELQTSAHGLIGSRPT
jgi:hypothetical protein